MKLVAVIAAMDERDNVGPLCRRLLATLRALPGLDFEVIFVVEGEDGTEAAGPGLLPSSFDIGKSGSCDWRQSQTSARRIAEARRTPFINHHLAPDARCSQSGRGWSRAKGPGPSLKSQSGGGENWTCAER